MLQEFKVEKYRGSGAIVECGIRSRVRVSGSTTIEVIIPFACAECTLHLVPGRNSNLLGRLRVPSETLCPCCQLE